MGYEPESAYFMGKEGFDCTYSAPLDVSKERLAGFLGNRFLAMPIACAYYMAHNLLHAYACAKSP